MIDFTSLPSSVAEPLNELIITERYRQFTFIAFVDDEQLFTDINTELKKLETSTDVNIIELEKIIKLSEHFQRVEEWKEEVLLRIDWLQRLYKAKDEVGLVDTKEKLMQLREVVAPVQTCPLKNQLLAEIDSLEASMPKEAIKEPTEFELLMENAMNEVGDVFINLGKTGREYVIAKVLKHEGDQATPVHVQTLAGHVEQRVLTLTEVSDLTKMIAELDQLPLSAFSALHEVKKERVAEALIQEKGWTGLFSLERKIKQISKAIDREEREKYERENVIDLPDGKAAATLDLRYNPID
ncbi:succinate dehydrogenase/fumarate reductase, flavoprotein subunit [Brevibacillus agri BAB-2500]|nr:succinate dehydrogenase/fumarate reductase, flavoprotein subunit [Brevibacillus agri BAB-2500]